MSYPALYPSSTLQQSSSGLQHSNPNPSPSRSVSECVPPAYGLDLGLGVSPTKSDRLSMSSNASTAHNHTADKEFINILTFDEEEGKV